MKIEILATCVSFVYVLGAVRCGANAIYLGTKDFNARRGAENFDNDDLKKAVDYCHARDVKVYLTLNTLVGDDEMKTAYFTVKNALECGVDAFIIQDLGVGEMIKSHFPTATLHASTQCSVMTSDGVNALEKLGYKRVVIPREMSFDEIVDLRKKTSVEFEMFVHGALCMSVSGQCYLSSMIGGRSGNRGLCAQPCRLSFSADNSGSFDLSLKDLSLIRHIKKIESAGVISLKIEGRMKRPEYVAAAVSACKKAINCEYDSDDETVLKSVFSRSGFTDNYFTGERQNMFGTRQKSDVVAASGVLKDLANLYHKETPLVKVDLEFTCRENEPIKLVAKTDKKEVVLRGVAPQKAINKPLNCDILAERLAKFGGTQYYLGDLKINLDDGLIVSAKDINALRRKAVETLDKSEKVEFDFKPYSEKVCVLKNKKPYLTARFLDVKTIPQNHNFKRIFIPIDSENDDFIKYNAGVEIPRGLFGVEEKVKNRLLELKNTGVNNALCGNLGSLTLAKNLGFNVYGDFGLNIFNSQSAKLFENSILSFELTLSDANKINDCETGIVGYGKLPLMLTRNCPIKNNIGCAKCKKNGVLTDRKGYKFQVVCSNYPCVEILNSNVLYLGDKASEIKTDYVHFYFTDENKDEVKKVVEMFKNREKMAKTHTKGLYFRGVE